MVDSAWPMFANEGKLGLDKQLRVDLASCEFPQTWPDVPTPSTCAATPENPAVSTTSPSGLGTELFDGSYPLMFPNYADLDALPAVPPPPDLADIPSSWNYNPFTAPAEAEPPLFPETPLEELYGGWPTSLSLPGLSGIQQDTTGSPGTPTPWQRTPSVDYPMHLKLKDLRALPSRGLGLHYDKGQFGVVSLPESHPSLGPAATVVREGAFPQASRGLPEVSWTVKDWVATRKGRGAGEDTWTVTDTVQLTRTPDATPAEWERRFCQREKQVMVGKGTRGYQNYVKTIPKDQRATRPVTPRVAEQCSKRAFDGRLKQWRIMLHAFSPRGSPESTPRTSGRESTEEGFSTEGPVASPPTTSLPTSKWHSPNGQCAEQSLFGDGFGSLLPLGSPEPCEDLEPLNAVLQALEQLRLAAKHQ